MAERRSIDAQNPWPWLDPFTESAASFFNGRDEDAQALLRSVLATPACVLFSKSGLGKTSLLLAGIFPLLRARNLLPVYLRAEQGAGAAGFSSQLLRALDDAIGLAGLHWSEANDHSPSDADDVALLWERLHDRRRRLIDAGGKRWMVVFVLDQFEEVFTLEADEQRRRQISEQLGDLVENRMPPSMAQRLDRHEDLVDHIDQDSQAYRFLLALREDFLPELEAWADIIPRLGPNRYRLMPMSREQALDAVAKTGGELVDAKSAELIVDFLGRQSTSAAGRVVRESRRIEPALLSLVCSSLNADRLAKRPPAQRLDVSDLENRGAQILDRFYDEAFAGLPEAQRLQAARWVESELITAGGTRRPYPLSAADGAFLPALRHLVDRRLLRIENTEQGDQVELVHDRLALVALRRAQLVQQRTEETERLQREKEAAERARDKAAVSAARRTRWLAMAFAAAVAVAWWADHEGTRRASEALAEAKKASEQASEAADQSKLKAELARQALQGAQSALDAAAKASEAAKLLRSDQPNRVSEANALLSEASNAYQNASRDVNQLQACPDGRRIYPHIGDEADRAIVTDKLGPALRAAGFIVPKVQVLAPEKMPRTIEVRYFRDDEKNGALAASAALATAGLPGVAAMYVSGYENSTSIRPCHYELWLKPGSALSMAQGAGS